MAAELQLQALSNPCWLQAIRGLARGYLNHFDLDPERVDDAVLALDEACANVIRHSYQGKTDKPIRLSLSADEYAITFLLEDDGVPASWDNVRPCVPEAPDPKNVQPGGLGVRLMYSVFDEVVYCPGESAGNCVLMRINREHRRKEQ